MTKMPFQHTVLYVNIHIVYEIRLHSGHWQYIEQNEQHS
jgi:hypothetical protein